MATRQRNRDEYIKLLREQVGYLAQSSKNFDEGQLSEYARLAVSIRVLVHDTKASVSLLTHLGIKQTLTYRNTAHAVDPKNLLSQQTLVIMRIAVGIGANFQAPLGDPRPPSRKPIPAQLGFGQWWGLSVVRDQAGSEFSRKDLVLTVSNKEGGAHVDEDLSEEWWALTRENSSGWVYRPGDIPVGSPVPASVRQIAYELQQTIEDQVPELEP